MTTDREQTLKEGIEAAEKARENLLEAMGRFLGYFISSEYNMKLRETDPKEFANRRDVYVYTQLKRIIEKDPKNPYVQVIFPR